MNWKAELKLTDLPAEECLEITCRHCGKTRYETAQDLLASRKFDHAYLDEVEKALHCHDRFCRGRVRIAQVHDGKTEGFVGGLA